MRWVKRVLIFLLLVVLAASVFGIWTVRRSFPTVDGEIEVAALEGEVTVYRDHLGVPHIYAESRHDLFVAQGYTHAQDRFYQMDFWRHIGSARLAEMFGSGQVDTDKFLRSLGFRELAEREWAVMDPEVKQILQSYADGVNSYLDTHSGSQISLEYAILPLQNSDYEIEPWSPLDTLTWAKVMSWDLSGNMSDEISRATLGKDLSPQQVDQLFPPFPSDKPYILDGAPSAASTRTVEIPEEAIEPLQTTSRNANQLWALTGGGFEGIGSNNWVVSGEHTSSGQPILANDTHLGIRMPSIWYGNGLHCEGCDFDVVGFSFPGTPGVVIGHNEHHAWGVTTEAADTQDLFIERVNPDNPDQYEVEGDWVDFETRREVIEVGGGEDVELTVRSTRHGPVISETFFDDDDPFEGSDTVETPSDYVIALSWQTLQPSTLVEAVVGMNVASSYDEFREAVSKWDIAAQNIVYADREGNIAYHSTGEIPIRSNWDGRIPVPGWSSEYEWTGIVPFDEMPSAFNPPTGYVVTANQPIYGPDTSPLIGIDGAYGYRAGRIEDMIDGAEPLTVATVQDMQMDARDDSAEQIIPYLTAVDSDGSERVQDLLDRLDSWSTGNSAFEADGGSNGAAVYMAVWRHLLANTFQDDLPEEEWPQGGSRWFVVMANLLEVPDDPFWDDAGTVAVETRDDIIYESLIAADREVSDLLGDDSGKWTWGALHTASFENQTLGQSGIGPIEWLFNRSAPHRVGGSSSLVNAIGWDTDESYVVDWLPSQRFVADLDDWSGSTFIHTTGQSGHAFHDDYDSMIELWTDGIQEPMLWTRDEVQSAAEDALRLKPSS